MIGKRCSEFWGCCPTLQSYEPSENIAKSPKFEDFIYYEFDEVALKSAFMGLGSCYYPNPEKEKYRESLGKVLFILGDPTEKGSVLREIE